MKLLTTPEMMARYGKPNQSGTYLVSAVMPWPLRLAWDLGVTVKAIKVHKLEKDRVESIFHDIAKTYSHADAKSLGIDLFGGCFAYRQMRGGDDWSKHSWGTAIDLDPARNKLHETKATARFARPEYTPLLDAFERHGWASLGRAKNYDFMHFEAAA